MQVVDRVTGLAVTATAPPAGTAGTVVLSWTPPAGMIGYEFLKDGVRVSTTWDGTVASALFSTDGAEHTFEVVALAPGSEGSVVVDAPPAPPGPGTTWYADSAYLDDPLPDLTNAVVCGSLSAFKAALAAAVAGQVIHATGTWTIPEEFTGFNRVVPYGATNPAKVVIDDTVHFVGPYPGQRGFLSSSAREPAVWLTNTGGWRVWGGKITCDNGGGILVYKMPGPFKWTGFDARDTADTCVACYAVGGDIVGLILKGTAGTKDPVLAYDPHAEKGTGIHAVNLENGTYKMRHSTVAVFVTDQATGAACEVRTDYVDDVTLIVAAEHLGFEFPAGDAYGWLGYAQQQVAGNIYQLWGNSMIGALSMVYAEGDNIQGRMVETGGVSSGADLSKGACLAGQATGPILQSPHITDKVAWKVRSTGPSLTADCQPRP